MLTVTPCPPPHFDTFELLLKHCNSIHLMPARAAVLISSLRPPVFYGLKASFFPSPLDEQAVYPVERPGWFHWDDARWPSWPPQPVTFAQAFVCDALAVPLHP